MIPNMGSFIFVYQRLSLKTQKFSLSSFLFQSSSSGHNILMSIYWYIYSFIGLPWANPFDICFKPSCPTAIGREMGWASGFNGSYSSLTVVS